MKSNQFILILSLFICNLNSFAQSLSDSLLAHYTFSDNLLDSGEKHYNILSASGTFTTNRFGQSNAAFALDGINDSLVLPIPEMAPISGDFAISFWYNTNSAKIMNLFSSKQTQDDTTDNFEMQLNSHNQYYLEYYQQLWYQTFVYWNGSGVDSNALAEGVAGNFIKGDWCHFVITREADTFKIYRNHQLYYLSIDSYFGNDLGDAVDLIFSASPYRFKGAVDDMRFYNRNLTQQDVDALWFENNPIQFVTPQATDAYVFGSNVLVYWEFDTAQISDSILVQYRINNGDWINSIHSNLSWENYTYIDMSYEPGTAVEVRVADYSDTSIFQVTGQFIVSPYDWISVNDSLPFHAKDGAGLLSFKNKMWLLGGWDPPFHEPTYTHNEVWSSIDGVTWNFETLAPWPPRHCAAWLSDENYMYVIGGDPQSGCLTDVWQSSDGINWVQLVDTIPGYKKRNMVNYAILNNQLTLFGGEQCSGNGLNDVWQSADGVTWINLPDAPWEGRGMQINNSVDDTGKMWMLSGANEGERRPFSEVWNTTDGITWNLINDTPPWMGRYWHTVAWFDNHIWVMGGITSGIELNDVWYSPDGIEWRELKSTTGNWPLGTRHAQSTTVFDNALWYMCGIATNNAWKIVNQFNPIDIESPINHANQITVSPNPTKGTCVVELNDDLIGKKYVITNGLGEILITGVITNKNQTIDLLKFPPGIYNFIAPSVNTATGIIIKQ